MSKNTKIIAVIENCDDPEKLKTIRQNALRQNEIEIAEIAFKKLVSIVPAENPGTVEYDFWQTVNAFEYTLSEERGRTTRLSRTRQKVNRVGVVQTLTDWAISKEVTDGFKMLLERGMPELTGEAIVLRHPDTFSPEIITAARDRLANAGVELDSLPMKP